MITDQDVRGNGSERVDHAKVKADATYFPLMQSRVLYDANSSLKYITPQ